MRGFGFLALSALHHAQFMVSNSTLAMITSHDPRMNRLGLPDAPATAAAKDALDQFETYEVFHQKKEGTAYVYVGPVYAPEADVAFLFAKEQYSRRAACAGTAGSPTRSRPANPAEAGPAAPALPAGRAR